MFRSGMLNIHLNSPGVMLGGAGRLAISLEIADERAPGMIES